MTIRPGDAWGRSVARPDALIVAAGDADIVAAVLAAQRDGPPVAVGGGDLARTLGNPPLADRAELNELPIDLVVVTVDGGPAHTACAHVTAHSPWWRGGWWRGPVVIAMNAEFLGGLDVAPRGHPNDGRIEVFEVASSMSVRARLAARRRARHAGHVPHPDITTRSLRRADWQFAAPMAVRVDGRRVGAARRMEIRVEPDAAVVYA